MVDNGCQWLVVHPLISHTHYHGNTGVLITHGYNHRDVAIATIINHSLLAMDLHLVVEPLLTVDGGGAPAAP